MIIPFVESLPGNIQVLLVSRFPEVLEADCKALSMDKHITVIGCAGTPDDALDMVRLQPPDVILSGAYFDNPIESGTGYYLARKVRSLHGLPFQPCITILTTALNYHILANNSCGAGEDYCFSRDSYSSEKDLISLIHFQYLKARKRAGDRITELRGDLAAQKSRWLRAALRMKIREDGILAEVIDDWEMDKNCFIEVLALVIESGGPTRCDLESMIAEVAAKFNTTQKQIARKALSYVKQAAVDARRHRPELSPDNPFVMDKHDVNTESVIAHYARVFSENEVLKSV